MIQDDTGYIWFGTANGLCRYDGYSFVEFCTTESGERNPYNNIGTLRLDHRNKLLWVRSATFNYSCYDLTKGHFVHYSGNCDARRTFERFTTEDNGIWMYEAQGGIRHVTYKDGTFTCQDYSQHDGTLPKGRINRIRIEDSGLIWVLTDRGLLRYNDKGTFDVLLDGRDFILANTWKDYTFFLTRGNTLFVFNKKGEYVREAEMPASLGSLDLVNGNIIWQDKWVIMTRKDVFTMDCRTMAFEKPKHLQMEYGIVLDHINGNYCVSDIHGALRFFTSTGEVRKLQLLNEESIDVSKKRNFSTILGPDGNYYIATYGSGLFIYHPTTQRIEHHTARDTYPILDTDYLTNIHRDTEGNIWIGQEEAGVVRLHRNYLKDYTILLPDVSRLDNKTNYITRLARTADGKILVGTKNQRHFLLDDNGMFSPIQTPSTKENYTDSLTDQWGRTWIATWEQGLLMVSKGRNGQRDTTSFLNQSISESRINVIKIDRNGMLWVATYHGIYVVDTKQSHITSASFRNFNVTDGLPTNDITCLLCASDGSLWAGGVGSGVMKCTLHEDSFKTHIVSTLQGLSNNNIHSLAEDHQGIIWVTADETIASVDPKSMKAVSHPVNTKLLNSLYSNNCALTLDDGRIMFGTHDGITVFTPQRKDTDHPYQTKAHITDLAVNGTSIYNNVGDEEKQFANGSISLPHDRNSIKLNFSSLDYANIGHTMYFFYLEGTEKTWREPSTQNSVEYSNLPPGNYVFHLKLDECGEETTLAITIHQPWYNTWWAWILYLIVIGTAGWLIYKHKREQFLLQQQMKLEKEVSNFRISFFTQIAHEFRTPLAIINGAIEKISESNTQRKTLQTARRASSRLLRLVNQLMEFRKINTNNMRLQVEEGDIITFVRDIYQDFWQMARQKDMTFSFTSSEKHSDIVFDRHLVDTIVYNLISNAIKYTPDKGSIIVKVSTERSIVTISVQDSGPGIDEQRQQQLFMPFMHGFASQGGMGIGLYTSHKMALAHKGDLTYQRSAALGGAQFTLTLPKDADCYAADEYRNTTAIEDDETRREEHESIIHEMLPLAMNDLRIAIIEDDLDMLEQIKSVVGVYFQVDGYTTGKEGYEHVRDQRPALLICDVMLPDMSGYDIVSQLKSDQATRNVPVIMLTALDDEQHQIKGYKAGADDYMVKPCNFQVLIARMAQLIKWNRTDDHDSAMGHTTEGAGEKVRDTDPILTNQADKRLLEQIDYIITRHLSDPNFNIDQMADLLHMGRTKLYGKVKELKGMPPNKLIVSERMRMAAALLLEGRLNISEIAYQVGFDAVSYFNRCFKQYYGMTPSQYKEQK